MTCLRWLAATMASFTITMVAHAQTPAARRPVPGAPAGVTAFVDVAVVPMDTERVLNGQTVLVEGGRITALGPSGRLKVPPGAAQVDGRGKFLIPGLSDCHAHLRPLTLSTLPQGPAYGELMIQRRLLEQLSAGVTTIRVMDLYGDSNATLNLRLKGQVAAGELLGPSIYTTANLAWPRKTTVDSLVQELTRYKAAGHSSLKIRFEGHNLAKFRMIMAAARQAGLPVVGHYPGANTLEQALASGMQSIEHVTHLPLALLGPSGLIPGKWFDGESYVVLDDSATLRRHEALNEAAKDPARAKLLFNQPADTVRARIAAMQRSGIWFCPTLSIADGKGHGGTMLDYAVANTPSLWATLDTVALRQQAKKLSKQLQDGGVGLLLGTDEYGSVAGELQLLVEAGLTPYEALATGTRNMARYLGALDSTGTVAVGRRADLVLLSGNPLENIQHAAQPAGVMFGGRWLPRTDIDQRLTALKSALAASR